MKLKLADEKATLAFGAQLAASCKPGMILFLQGDLGAGKTTLVRGFFRGLGYEGLVKSPTYSLVETYEIAENIHTHSISLCDEARAKSSRAAHTECMSSEVSAATKSQSERRRVYHFDLYRLGTPEELEFIGIRDYFDGQSTCLIEWPECAEGILPKADLICCLKHEALGRSIHLTALSKAGKEVIKEVKE